MVTRCRSLIDVAILEPHHKQHFQVAPLYTIPSSRFLRSLAISVGNVLAVNLCYGTTSAGRWRKPRLRMHDMHVASGVCMFRAVTKASRLMDSQAQVASTVSANEAIPLSFTGHLTVLCHVSQHPHAGFRSCPPTAIFCLYGSAG